MAVRVLLVGLVAALGLDLPSSAEFAGWRAAGHRWALARMAELSSLRVEAERALAFRPEGAEVDPTPDVATSGEAPSTRVDLAFEAVVEGMTSGFSVDLAAMGRAGPPVEEAVALAGSPREDSQGPALAPEPSPASEAPSSRLDRIATAVRLTRRAVGAWASVIQPTADPSAEGETGDAF